MNEDVINVFVYGTLKVGGRFAHRFDHQRENVEEATTKGSMFDCGWYPCIILDDKNTVHGELHTYRDPEEVIERFDRIEGYVPGNEHNLYNRKIIEVTTISGETKEALVYEYANKERAHGEFKQIEDGRWEI